jgi:acyl-CoA thioesterase-1
MPACFFVRSLAYGPIRALRNLLSASIFLLVPFVAPASAEPLHLLALGDSLTQGYGLAPDEGLVPQLEAWLRANGADVTIINAGVSGDTTAGGRARLGWSLTPEVDAVMVALGGNDLLRGLPPEEARANLSAILEDLAAQGLPALLVGLPAPGNYGPVYQQSFDAIWPELSAQYDTLLVPNFLGPIMDLPLRERTARDYMQDDAIHPSAEGVTLIVEALGPTVLTLLERAGTP